MAHTTTYDHTSVMQAAWAAYRRFKRGLAFCRKAFGGELRRAWASVKLAAFNTCPMNRTRAAIQVIENKTHLTQQDYARIGVLRTALRAKQAVATRSGEQAGYAA